MRIMEIKQQGQFSDCQFEAPPTSVEECVNQDKVTATLCQWPSQVQSLGRALLLLVILGGTVASYGSAMVTNNSGNKEFTPLLFIASFLTYLLYAVGIYIAYNVTSLLIAALARITQSNRTMARLAELEARQRAANPVNKQ